MKLSSQSTNIDHLVLISLALIASAFLLLLFFPTLAALIAVRIVLFAALCLSAFILRQKNPLLLASPFFLLAAMSLCFFALLPWAVLLTPQLIPVGIINPIAIEPDFPHVDTVDRLILGFAAVNLGLAAVFAKFGFLPALQPLLPGPRWRVAVLMLIIVMGGLHATTLRLNLLSPQIWTHKQILDAFPPLLSILVATAFLDALARSKMQAGLILLFSALVFAVLFPLTGTLKIGIYLITAMAILLIATDRPWSKSFFFVGILVIIAAVLFGNYDKLRVGNVFQTPRIENFLSKTIGRQIESRFCLGKVLAHISETGPREESPFYFFGAFVPRVLWPDKPDYSALGGIAEKMCFNASGSSYSMTLLGESLLHAGGKGLALAGIFFVIVQSLLLGAVSRVGPLGLVAMLALAPWLMDFDQFFALYWANIFKMLIYMMPVLAAVFLGTRVLALHPHK